MDEVLEVADGRRVGFATFGDPGGTAVLWCHGGPGSRREPAFLDAAAADAGLLLVGIDRPGYGRSTPRPGRSIADSVPDALAVADAVGAGRFATVGVSTGGAHALAIAALAPHRVIGVVACCAMTDMRDERARGSMSPPHAHAVWDAPDREAAIAAAEDAHGRHGEKMVGGGMGPALAPSDAALFADPAWMGPAMEGFGEMFTFGLEGYADDRLADGGGWTSFDVSHVRCPVTVLHGRLDRMVAVFQAEQTAGLLPDATLEVFDDLGHFSIETQVVPAIERLLQRAGDR